MQEADWSSQAQGEKHLAAKDSKNLTGQTPLKAFSDFLVSFFYALLRFAAGLLVHPYQTMQLLTEEVIFVWLAFLPTLILGFLTLIWKMTLEPVTRVIGLLISNGMQAGLLGEGVWFSFVVTWVVVFCLYWQLLLFYLLLRFTSAFGGQAR